MYKIKSIIFILLSILCISGYSQTQYYVSTLAGDTANIYLGPDSNAGYRDGFPLGQAKFNGPTGIAIDNTGEYIYVADTYNNIIRKINILFNDVTTIAGDTADIKKGLDSSIGYVNSSSPMKAKFNNPWGVCVDNTGNVYVADTYNNVIRKIAVSGQVTTYAGKDSAGTTFNGYVDGPDSLAEFSLPLSLASDTAGNIYVADYGNNNIREIVASTHTVKTIAGQGPDTIGYVNGPIDTAELYGLYGIALGKKGDVYTSQFANGYNAVRRVYHDTVSTYSGYDTIGFDTSAIGFGSIPTGYKNGHQGTYLNSTYIDTLGDTITYIAEGVLYNSPTGIAFDTSGNLLVADENNNVIRIMNAQDSIVSTFAGNKYTSIPGYVNGADSVAEFYEPMGVVADKKGNFYVADLGNNLIRKISTQNIAGVTSLEKPASSLNVYPNPCSSRLNIVSSSNGSASLLDLTGRVIWTNNDFKSPYILSTEDISPGIYFLHIVSSSTSQVKKVEIVK